MKSKWQQSIEEFMRKAGQAVPDKVTEPDEDTRLLRAKLIYEEAIETITALGVQMFFEYDGSDEGSAQLRFEVVGDFDLEGVADGCADILVVTIGTFSACGIHDNPVMHEVNQANLRKFDIGGYRRDDGKWMKPPDWQPPDIMKVLESQ